MPKKLEVVENPFVVIAEGLKTAAVKPNIHGYIPHEKQVKFHGSNHRIRLFLGGNRSGKTVGGATETVMYATGKHKFKRLKWQPPVNLRVVATDFIQGMGKITLPEVIRWMPLGELKGGSFTDAWHSEYRTLTLRNGSTIEWMSYEQDLEKFAGTSRHAVWFDEEPPRSIFVECQMRTVDVEGDMWLTMTPVEGMTWTYDGLYEMNGKADETGYDVVVIEVASDENVHLNQAEIDMLFAGLDEDERKARKEGKYVHVGGLVYKMFNADLHVIDQMIPPREWMHFAMMDAGFNNPTAWYWGAVNNEGEIIVYDEHYESQRTVDYHAKIVLEKEKANGRVPVYRVGDPSIRNTDPISGTSVQIEYIENGVAIVPGNNDVKAGLVRVAGMLKGTEILGPDGEVLNRPKLYITRNCERLIWEIPRYRWSTWATKKMQEQKNPKDEPHKKDDHGCDALRYGVMSRPMMDDGSGVPDLSDIVVPESPVGASVSVSAMDRYDEELMTPDMLRDRGLRSSHLNPAYENYDDVLGSDW